MGLSKLVSQTAIKSDGSRFHELFRYRPNDISIIHPQVVQSCELCEGQWGNVGSIICWNYTHDGRKKIAKEIIEAIDEGGKLIKFKVIEGDLLEAYKSFKIQFNVETNGEDNVVTWTLEYEKKSEVVPDPRTFMDTCLGVTREVDRHHSLVVN